MGFLDNVRKDLEKAGAHVGSSEPPRWWISTGNHVLNKIISGSFNRGIPQGRLLCLTGPSGSGKSFLAANAMREAQKEGCFIVVLDSENALDDDFVRAVGVDPTHEDYTYISVDTIPEVTKFVSTVLNKYEKEYGDDPDAPKMVFFIDSLDMLVTATEKENFIKGDTKGDQGQRSKQLKAMLRNFVQAVKRPNISMVVTAQVYRNQDVKNGEGVWIVSDAIRYSLSQVVLLTKLKLKETGKSEVLGIRMKCEGFKTRFTKPYQTVTVEVPYDTGMDPYNGLLEVAVEMGIVENRGSMFYVGDKKWKGKLNMPAELAPNILAECESRRDKFLIADVSDDEIDMSENGRASALRKQKFGENSTEDS